MAFTDPVIVNFGSVDIPCTRVGVGSFSSTYKDVSGDVTYSASSTYGRRTRSTIRLDYKQLVQNPEIPATNNPVSMSSYLVIDRNSSGFDPVTLKAAVVALLETLADDDYEKIDQVLQGQS
jgi:hypothetical protein